MCPPFTDDYLPLDQDGTAHSPIESEQRPGTLAALAARDPSCDTTRYFNDGWNCGVMLGV